MELVPFLEASGLIKVSQLFEALRYKTRGPVFDSRCIYWKFISDLNLLLASSNHGIYSACNIDECQGIFLGGKVRPARKADNSVVLVVPKVKVRIEAQNSISLLSLREDFAL
jgi:hypothetical protein